MARRLRGGGKSTRLFVCSWHLPDWFGRCCRRSGRSQPNDPLSAQSQPGAAADGAHNRSCPARPRALSRAQLPGLLLPRALLPLASLLFSLEATPSDPRAPPRPALPLLRPFPRRQPAVSRALRPAERLGHGHPRDAASRRAPAAHQNVALGGQRRQSHPKIPLRGLVSRARSRPERLQLVSGRRQAGQGDDRGGRAASGLLDGAGSGTLGPGLAEPCCSGPTCWYLEGSGVAVRG